MEKQFENIYQMFENTVSLKEDKPSYFERIEDKWIATSWNELKSLSDKFAMALLEKIGRAHV